MTKLKKYLSTLPEGGITETSEIEVLLAEAWDRFQGDWGGMTADKIHGRLENVVWDPPLLTFRIERHGGMSMGSTRAELQTWFVDTDKGHVSCQQTGYRQISKRRPSLATGPLAEEVSKLIIDREESEDLKWYDGMTRVRVLISQIIPGKNVPKETLAGRRKRFRRDLTECLREQGWEEVRPNSYRFTGSQ